MGGLFTHGVDGWQFQLFELGFLLDVGGKITPHFVCMFLALKAQEKIRQQHKFSVAFFPPQTNGAASHWRRSL